MQRLMKISLSDYLIMNGDLSKIKGKQVTVYLHNDKEPVSIELGKHKNYNNETMYKVIFKDGTFVCIQDYNITLALNIELNLIKEYKLQNV